MHKILLVYDDYTELNNVQSTLKKIGFDCVGISSEFTLSQQVVSFNPDIVIGSGKGPKVTPLGVGRRLKEMPRWNGKTILIFSGAKPKPEELIKIRMDVVLEMPVSIPRLVQVLASLTDQDERALLTKLAHKVAAQADAARQALKNAQKEKERDNIFVSGTGAPDNKIAEMEAALKKARTAENKAGGQTGQDQDQDFFVAKGEVPNADSSAPSETKEEPTVSDLTPDKMRVNWDEFTTELFGKTAKQANPSLDVTPEDAKRHQNELKIHGVKLAEKVKKYDKFTKNLTLSSESGLKKTETRKAQKELRKSLNEDDLQSQDELRREFTKALFKNKKK